MRSVAHLLVAIVTLALLHAPVLSQEALRVDANGNVGIGTTNPETPFALLGNGASIPVGITQNQVGGVSALEFTTADIGQNQATRMLFRGNTPNPPIEFYGGNRGQETLRMIINTSLGHVGIGTDQTTHPITMGSGAHVTSGGVWTNASSRAFKENIANLSVDDALAAFESLVPVRYNYKVDTDESYLGFIAEDVPELVATQDRKGVSSMDIVALLTKVVQHQQQQIEALEARFDENR